MKMKLVRAVFCMSVATEKVLGVTNPLATHYKSSSSLIRGIILSFSLVQICPVEVALFICLLFCHTKWITSRIKTIINRLINIKYKICTLLGRSDCGREISEKPSLRGIEISPDFPRFHEARRSWKIAWFFNSSMWHLTRLKKHFKQ